MEPVKSFVDINELWRLQGEMFQIYRVYNFKGYHLNCEYCAYKLKNYNHTLKWTAMLYLQSEFKKKSLHNAWFGRVIKNWNFVSWPFVFIIQAPLPSKRFQASNLTFPYLCFLLCEMGIIMYHEVILKLNEITQERPF